MKEKKGDSLVNDKTLWLIENKQKCIYFQTKWLRKVTEYTMYNIVLSFFLLSSVF